MPLKFAWAYHKELHPQIMLQVATHMGSAYMKQALVFIWFD